MEEIILQILGALRRGERVDDRALVKLVNAAARRTGSDKRAFAKRRLLPFYQRVKRDDPERWTSWGIMPELERQLLGVLRMKPRRSASGVATITVITKPWPCSGSCVFCPSDVRCPKSYLADEPACARAVQVCFDPYLQVSARLTTLAQMGHATDKIELIVLGGTWSDYPEGFQIWFMRELFRALNDRGAVVGEYLTDAVRARYDGYVAAGLMAAPAGRAAGSAGSPTGQDGAGRPARGEAGFAIPEPVPNSALDAAQAQVTAGALTYNQAVARLYGDDAGWLAMAREQQATWRDLEAEQVRNERAAHRVVGLVIETRPDAITPEALASIRRMGATKIQMGVQSVDQEVLDANGRGTDVAQIECAFSLLRLFGFKLHVHAMVNLLGSTPARDREDYRRLVSDPAFQPDEVKLYPCALIESARLRERYERGEWVPYTEEELVGVLTDDVLATPAFCRVSRMIRDFSTGDIVAGNKKPNLRQLVEERLRERCAATGERVREIRFREIATSAVDMDALRLDEVAYETPATSERFLQWVTPEGRIAGFLRLSLPACQKTPGVMLHRVPIAPGEAMIREVHVYGMAERVGETGSAAQHHGLGRKLVERACEIARAAGYERINVISAVGTRGYYRNLGFYDHGLYQLRALA